MMIGFLQRRYLELFGYVLASSFLIILYRLAVLCNK